MATPTKILTQSQAQAVVNAISALGAVGSSFGDVRIAGDRAQHDIRVQWGEGCMTVGRGLKIAVERYDGQAAFAEAYGLKN